MASLKTGHQMIIFQAIVFSVAQSNVHDERSPVHEAGSCFVGVKEDIVSHVEY